MKRRRRRRRVPQAKRRPCNRSGRSATRPRNSSTTWAQGSSTAGSPCPRRRRGRRARRARRGPRVKTAQSGRRAPVHRESRRLLTTRMCPRCLWTQAYGGWTSLPSSGAQLAWHAMFALLSCDCWDAIDGAFGQRAGVLMGTKCRYKKHFNLKNTTSSNKDDLQAQFADRCMTCAHVGGTGG